MTVDGMMSVMVGRIVEKFQPVSIMLFGSRARGDIHKFSDVDLLVIMKTVPDKRKAAIEIRRALLDIPISKDIIVASTDEVARRRHVVGNVIYEALLEGKILYERH